MPQLLKNNVTGALSAGIGPTATGMTLVDASSFPDPGADYYLATLVGLNGNGLESSWEIVRVTAKASNTLTIVRGQESTVAQSWPGATTVQMRLTAASVPTKDEFTTHASSTSNPHSVTKAQVGLGNVENTALSTWSGSGNLTTVGTVASGVWQASAVGIAYGGTGATTKAAGFNALSPATTLGDLIFGDGANSNARLAGNTAASRRFLRQTGTGTVSAAPAWDALVDGDIPSALTGKTYNALTLGANAVGFSISGGVTSKTFTVNNSITLNGTDGTTITLPSTTGTVALNSQTFFLGTTSVAINRASAAISLAGVSIDGSAGSATTATTSTHLASGVLGSLPYQSAAATTALLAPNTTATRNFLRMTGTGSAGAAPAWDAVTKTDVGLSNVENTALSTWAGSVNITTLGTIASGTWNGTAISIARGGTGQTTALAAFDALSPATTLGDLIYHDGTDNVRLAGSTANGRRFLRQTGTGTISAVPAWDALTDGDIPSTLTGKTYNGLTLTAAATGFTLAGGTTSKTLTVNNSLTLSGTDASALNIGAGGALGSAAFTASTAYAPAAGSSSITTVGTLTSNLTIANGTDSRVNLQVSGVTEGILTASSTNVRLSSANAIPITIGTNGVTRLTFTGTGFITTGASEYVGIGQQAGTNNGLRVARNLENDTTAHGVVSDGTFQSGVTGTGTAYRSVLRTQAASFTMANAIHYQAAQAALGAGSAVTTQSGFTADSSLTGATSNYGFRGSIPTGAGRWNLFMDGTAANFLAGNLIVNAPLGFGASGSPSYGTAGQALVSGGSGAAPTWGDVVTPAGTQALTGKTYNGLSLTANATGFQVSGGTTAKTLVVSNNLTLAGTDGSTLNIGGGGTLGTGAYATIAGYALLASPTFTGTPAAPTAAVDTSTTQIATTAYVVGQGYLKSATAATTYLPLTGGAVTGTLSAAKITPTGGTATGNGMYLPAADTLAWSTNSTERLRLGASGGFDVSTGLREARVAMGASDIDVRAGNYFTRTISGATTLTVSNVPTSGTAASFILDLTNGGSATITWWSGMKWAGGTAPTLTAAGRDVLGFFTHDGGATWSGLLLGKDVK
jgi:hypothetical protein